MMKKIMSIAIFLIAVPGIIFTVLFFSEKGNKSPIKVGYISILSGRQSVYNVHSRNGVLLAIEELNAAGGINGHHVEVIIKDTSSYEGELIKAVNEFQEEKVAAIIGPSLSATAVKIIPIINEKQILLISPAVSTELLTGKDDFFIRVMIPDKEVGLFYAKFIQEELRWKKVAVIYDISNKAYAEGYFQYVKAEFEKYGNKMELAGTFHSDEGYGNIVENAINHNPDGVLIIANPFDTANICQALRIQSSRIIPVAASEWAFTPELIKNGGKSVEGIIIVAPFFNDLNNTNLQNFSMQYEKRFGMDISFHSVFGYDAANVLIEGLKRDHKGDSEELKKNILDIGVFTSLVGDFEIDGYGDAKRDLETLAVRDGEFVRFR